MYCYKYDEGRCVWVTARIRHTVQNASFSFCGSRCKRTSEYEIKRASFFFSGCVFYIILFYFSFLFTRYFLHVFYAAPIVYTLNVFFFFNFIFYFVCTQAKNVCCMLYRKIMVLDKKYLSLWKTEWVSEWGVENIQTKKKKKNKITLNKKNPRKRKRIIFCYDEAQVSVPYMLCEYVFLFSNFISF